DDETYLGAENSLNLFTVSRNVNAVTDEERSRLEITGEYHLGELVNAFAPGSLVMSLRDGESLSVPTLLFGTANGVIGVLASLPKDVYEFTERLQALGEFVICGSTAVTARELDAMSRATPWTTASRPRARAGATLRRARERSRVARSRAVADATRRWDCTAPRRTVLATIVATFTAVASRPVDAWPWEEDDDDDDDALDDDEAWAEDRERVAYVDEDGNEVFYDADADEYYVVVEEDAEDEEDEEAIEEDEEAIEDDADAIEAVE
ncbi:Cleavage/polyadenylation specificity factor, A subunit, C-terminal, partial [Ostreococcus tauri]